MRGLDRIANRPRFYANVDGIGELNVAFLCLVFGALQWLQLHSSAKSVWNRMYTLFVVVGVMSLILHYGTRAIRSRITWPRTGYVEYRKRDTVWLPLIIGCTTAAAISVVLFLFKGPTALIGVLFAAAYAHGVARSTPWKWAVFAVILAGTVVLAAYRVPLRESLILYITGYGAILLVSGAITLALYLRRTE